MAIANASAASACGFAGSFSKRTHHMLYLALFRATNADDGLLNLAGGVLKDRQVLVRRRDNRHSARLPKLQAPSRHFSP